MIELTFLQELILIKHAYRKSLLLATIAIFIGKFQPTLCNRCHNVLMMPIHLNDITILNIHRINNRCITSEISEIEDVNLLKNADLTEKSRFL